MKARGVAVEAKMIDGRRDSLVFKCSGYIDTYNAPQVHKAIEARIENSTKYLIFDLSKVTYISSSGIGVFVTLLKNVKHRNGDIILVGMINRVYHVLSLLGFADFFTKTDSVREALNRLPTVKIFDTEIPFQSMEDVVGTFKTLEHFVLKEKMRDYYHELLKLFKQIQELKTST